MLSLSKHVRWASLLLLAGCAKPGAEAPKSERVACALDGATDFAEVCRLERDGPRFSVHRPDGGFRRFEPIDGRIHLIDGADAALVLPRADGFTELVVGGDRYRVLVARPRDSADRADGE